MAHLYGLILSTAPHRKAKAKGRIVEKTAQQKNFEGGRRAAGAGRMSGLDNGDGDERSDGADAQPTPRRLLVVVVVVLLRRPAFVRVSRAQP